MVDTTTNDLALASTTQTAAAAIGQREAVAQRSCQDGLTFLGDKFVTTGLDVDF